MEADDHDTNERTLPGPGQGSGEASDKSEGAHSSAPESAAPVRRRRGRKFRRYKGDITPPAYDLLACCQTPEAARDAARTLFLAGGYITRAIALQLIADALRDTDGAQS